MCGILTYWGDTPLTPDHPALTSVAHRGPDGSGLRTFPVGGRVLTLGHRRLSIIDLSDHAAQPMHDPECDLWITYNGEIYNYLELRQELERAGDRFRTASDTEVLLAAYRRWGAACLPKLNGMFAFTIWDGRSNTLFAARDRFGIKPLYVWNTSQGLALVSEIKQLIGCPHFQARLNLEAAFQFLQYADFSYNRETLWEGVTELEPGHCMRLNLSTWQPGDALPLERWYDFQPALTPVKIGETEAIEHFQHLFEDAVALRLRADVPVGTALSGGVDSSAITCLIAKKIRPTEALRTYSACYQEQEGDERPFIRHVLDAVQVRSSEVVVDPDYVTDHMEFVTWMHDLPVIGRSVFPYYNLCEHIHTDALRVVLQGQGADEIMAGYGEFHWAFLGESLLNLRGLRAFREHRQFRKHHADSLKTDTRRLLRIVAPSLFAPEPGQRLQDLHKSSFFPVDVLENLARTRQHTIRQQKTVKAVHKARMVALRMLLHNVDRASMAHSIEVRVPFLDHRLVEFCLSLPTPLKIRNGTRKYILREALKEVLPPAIRNRTKMGFASPETAWSRGPLKALYRKYLTELEHNPLIDAQAAREKYERFVRGEIPFDRALWRLISFQCWLSEFRVAY